jgi:hypothetical protein
MSFTRITNVSGVSVIEDVDININFSYSSEAPELVNFSFTTPDGVSVSGSCDKDQITYYYVNNGIVTDEFITLVKIECQRVLTNYETV